MLCIVWLNGKDCVYDIALCELGRGVWRIQRMVLGYHNKLGKVYSHGQSKPSLDR
jgi:hypothetical protein